MIKPSPFIELLASKAAARLKKYPNAGEIYDEGYIKIFRLYCLEMLTQFQFEIDNQNLGQAGELVYAGRNYRQFEEIKKGLEMMEKMLKKMLKTGTTHQKHFAVSELRRTAEDKIKVEAYLEFFALKLSMFTLLNLN